ncbi:MAG: hypothetical protein R3F59_21870 [Myxococcota bacterium]
MTTAELSLTLPVDSPEDRALARYEQLRLRLHLPRVAVRTTAHELTVTFEPFPAPLPADDVRLTARAVSWLAGLERAWGAPLGRALHLDEVRFDAARGLFVVGPGLIRPSGTREELDRLAANLDTSGDELDAYGALAALAARRLPSLAPLLQEHPTAEDAIRHLRDLARGAEPEAAVTYTAQAFEIRPQDPVLVEELVAAWLAAERPGEPPGAHAALRAAATTRPRAAVLAAQVERRAGSVSVAQQWAERGVALAPDEPDAWAELARVCRAAGETGRVVDALVALARLGNGEALKRVVQLRGIEVWGPLLDAWRGPWTPSLVAARLEQLYQQERLKELVLTFLDHLSCVEEGPAYRYVFEAADRRGALEPLRQDLWRQVEAGEAGPAVTLLAELCLRAGAHDALVRLAGQHPDRVPKPWVAEALEAERAYERLLAYAPDEPGLASHRLRAMLQLELTAPGRFDRVGWRDAITSCVAAGQRSGARSTIDELAARMPGFGPLPLLCELLGGES